MLSAAGFHRPGGCITHIGDLRFFGCLQANLNDDFEFQFADPDLISRIQNFGFVGRQTIVIDIGAVATVQILNQNAIVANDDDAVLATDRLALGTQLARLTSPHQELVCRQSNFFALVAPRQDLELHLHRSPNLH